jgi:hypothetical protein
MRIKDKVALVTGGRWAAANTAAVPTQLTSAPRTGSSAHSSVSSAAMWTIRSTL